jgi:hypothetical protein
MPETSSHLPPESAYFLAVNRNKRSITVNFKKPKGLEILHKLVAKADVLVENFIPGKLDSMGLGYAECSSINDKLIYASVTGMSSPNIPLSFLNACRLRLWTNRALPNCSRLRRRDRGRSRSYAHVSEILKNAPTGMVFGRC